MRSRHEAARFGVLIYDGVEPIDIGGTVGVVSMAARILPNLSAVTIAARPGPVRLAGGLTVTAEHGFEDAPPCDRLVVCGGPGWQKQATDPAILSFLRAQVPEQVASVCTGAMILAAAGLLDHRAATTRRHAVGSEPKAPLDLLRTYGSAIDPRPAVIVDSGVVTGGGVSLAIDSTLYLIGTIYGEAVRDEVARLIEYDRAWDANQHALGLVRSRD